MKVMSVGIVFLATLFIWLLFSLRRSLPCPSWLGWLVERDNPFTPVHRAKKIVENADIHEGMTVLDAGCGPGRVTIPAALVIGPSGKVVALDIQEGMLRQVSNKAQQAKLENIEFLRAGLGEKKLQKGKFDRALLVTVLGEIPNQKLALQEIFDALKPGGMLSVTETVFDPHYQSRNKVARLASEIGFQEKAFFGNRIAYTLNLQKIL